MLGHTEETQTMPEAHSSQSSFPLTQREIGGRDARISQCGRVRKALALGVGGAPKGAGPAARRGIYR